MPRKNFLKDVRRIVVKVGSSSLTERGVISPKKITKLVNDISALMKRDYEVALVTSGAIAAGAGSLRRKPGQLTIPEKQALAAVGQTILMNEYGRHFRKKGYQVGQILLTEDDVKNRKRFLNARHTMNTLLGLKIVPIVNENDTVVVKEIKFGDNDTLSSHVAGLIDADLLVILSDVNGFYRDLNDEKPVDEIYEITEDIIKRAGGAGSESATGGMITKIQAAQRIIRFGEMMLIANSAEKNVLQRIMNGERIGTIFIGKDKSLSSRKKWLSLRATSSRLRLDNGAVEAIRVGKKSLLASGIAEIDGFFEMGDIVELVDMNNNPVGKGIVNYSHAELNLIRGKKTREIKGILGSTFFDEVINRDDLVIY